jgi:hypothetical protein
VITVFLSGEVGAYTSTSFDSPSPSGRAIASSQQTLGCMFISSHSLRMVDMDTGRTFAAVDDEEKVYTAWAWSPDSSELLFQERDFVSEPPCEWARQPPRYGLLTVSGDRTAVTEPAAVYERWLGDRYVSLSCPRGEEAILFDRFLEVRSECDPPGGRLLLNGQFVAGVGPYASVHILGFR